MRAALGLALALAPVSAWAAGCRSDGKSEVTSDGRAKDDGPAVAALEAGLPMAAVPTAEVPPNALGMPSARIVAVVNPKGLPVYTGPTRSLAGTVLVRGPDAPDVPGLDVRACPAALDTYGKLFRTGPRRADGARPLADAIVVVTGYEGFYLPEKTEAQRVTIGRGCAYPSRTIALTFGQRLEVANESALPFAPKIEGGDQLSVMIAAPFERGEPVKLFPPRADYFPLRDELQKFVHGDLYVLRQPLHAVTDLAGHFRIDGVPTGRLTVTARSAAILGQAARDVDVGAGDSPSPELVLVLTYAPTR